MDGDTSNKALERGASAYVKHHHCTLTMATNATHSATKDTEFTNGIYEDAKADVQGRVRPSSLARILMNYN